MTPCQGAGTRCASSSSRTAANSYEPPFEFTGKFHSVTVDVVGELIKDEEGEVARLMAQQ